jgi:hypothetical protein
MHELFALISVFVAKEHRRKALYKIPGIIFKQLLIRHNYFG